MTFWVKKPSKSFSGVVNTGCMQQRQCHHVLIKLICKISLKLFCIWTSYVSHSGYLVLILEFYAVTRVRTVRLHDVNSFFNHVTHSSKHFTCRICLPRKYDIISQFCHSYAKGPICVTRLKFNIKNYWLCWNEIHVGMTANYLLYFSHSSEVRFFLKKSSPLILQGKIGILILV